MLASIGKCARAETSESEWTYRKTLKKRRAEAQEIRHENRNKTV